MERSPCLNEENLCCLDEADKKMNRMDFSLAGSFTGLLELNERMLGDLKVGGSQKKI